jgi:hypothetical protein
MSRFRRCLRLLLASMALTALPGTRWDSAAAARCSFSGSGGQHGYQPSHPRMPTGFIAAGDGVRAGVTLERVRLIDVAPTAARLLGIEAPSVEGRVLEEILR